MSSSPSDIKRSSSQIYRLREDVGREMRAINNEFNNSTSYWSGLASTAFTGEQNKVENSGTTLTRKIEGLEDGMNRLANEVKRAEEEREEKRRLQQKLKALKKS